MNDSYQNYCVTAEIDQSHQIQSDNHSCNDCEAIFTNLTNLEKHKQLHNENSEFICLLCKEVFNDFQKLKLHDLRHSLEEANEDIIDIDKLVSPLGFSCCECSKSFSCDQELIDHCVLTHIKSSEGLEPTNCDEVLPTAESNDLESLESCDSEEDDTNYPLLREEVISTRNGDQYIRFTLIDHQNCHVEEFTHLLHRKSKMKFISPQRSTKSRTLTTSKQKFRPSQNTVKRKISKSNLKQSKTNFVNGIAKGIKNKKEPQKNIVLSSDSELDISVEPSDPSAPRQRRSKLLALKKKIWRDNSGNSLLPKITKGTIKSNTPKANKVSFDKNDNTENDIKSYSCFVCEQVIVSKVEFENHLIKHSQNGIISCSKCQRNFTSARNIMRHSCGSKACVSCKLCNYEFPRVANFRRHLLRVHRMKEDEAALIIESTPKSSICHVCKNAFSSFASLKRHVVKVHKVSQEKAESLIASFPRIKLSEEQEGVGEENETQLVDNSVIETQGCPPISSEANSEESEVKDTSSEIQQNDISFHNESKTEDISIKTKRLTGTKKQASSKVKKVFHLNKLRPSNLEEVINRNKQFSLNVKKVTGPNKLKVKKIVSSGKQNLLNKKKVNNQKSLIMNKIHNLNKPKSLITQRVNSIQQTPLLKKKLAGCKKNIIDSKKKIANPNKQNSSLNSSVLRKSSRSSVVSIVAVVEKSTANIISTKKTITKMNGIPAINSNRGNLNKKSTLTNVKQVFKKKTPISPPSKKPKNKSVNNKASLKKNIKTKNAKGVVKSARKNSVSPKTKTEAKKSIVKSVSKSVAKKSSLKKNGKILRTTPKDIKRSKK